MTVHPLEQLSAEDVASRETVLEKLRVWSRTNAAAFGGRSLLVHGSVARGDYWAGGDVDLLLEGGDEDGKYRLHDSLREALPGVTFDLWRLDQPIATFCGRAVNERRLPSPMQFGLYGFDVLRHHLVLFGSDFLTPFVPTSGAELVDLAKDRLTKLVTPRQPGHADDPPKKAMEALKAAAIIVLTRDERPASRDKRMALTTFLDGTKGLAIPHDTAIKAWSAYRYGTAPPETADLDAFVGAVEAAFR